MKNDGKYCFWMVNFLVTGGLSNENMNIKYKNNFGWDGGGNGLVVIWNQEQRKKPGRWVGGGGNGLVVIWTHGHRKEPGRWVGGGNGLVVIWNHEQRKEPGRWVGGGNGLVVI